MELDPSWADLIHEALVEILRKLDFEDISLSVPLVCKNWRSAALDPACWEVVNIEKCFEKRQETSLWWQPAFEIKMDCMVKLAVDRSCGNLRELRTRHCSDSALSYLATRCHNVECIAVISCPGVTDLSASEVAAACTKLEYLDVSECQHLTCFSLQQFGMNCKSLTVVKRSMINKNCDVTRKSVIPEKYLRDFPSANADEEVLVISRLIPQLKSLVMRYSNLTDQGLQSLVQGCPSLEYLDLLGSSNLTRKALDHAGETLKSLKVFLRPRVPALNNLGGARYGHWQMPDPAYRGVCFLPLPRVSFAYIPNYIKRD